ncbi:MAG: inorganic phosphate transporter [Flavobacteriaceae bacterium]|nr:inorganic phosphate transporter [Flavobacteriaceae bacterium]
MESLYVFIVGLLFILAVFDLIVGVSNDAVNFLNSAIGSNVAKWRTIIIIASIGIMLGAMSSGGMMEVARKGIFNPQYFYFNEIMVLFLAVMITDIILLDLFNTFGMPTSTTVSIVFEILGASFALSVIKILQGNLPMNVLFNNDNPDMGIEGFMNWEKASEIISGILLSVVIAFTIGAIVQFISRFLFSFRYTRYLKTIGSIFSGIAFAAILYFLIFKGMGSFVKDVSEGEMNMFQSAFSVFYNWIASNIILFLSFSVIAFSMIMFIVQMFKINPLRLVVLFGTFSLAMAFAGNDLVNFIGVPIAGWQAYNLWSQEMSNPETFLMTGLAGKVATPYFMLMLAGVIMTVTLWLSKKARTVTETEVKLAAQSEIDERFKPNFLARAIVNGSAKLNKGIVKTIPGGLLEKLNQRFAPVDITDQGGASAHFDLVRASVNLVTASILIAVATDLKLPLSTTYVSFMVAMGTSLADRAWGRESAVYRIAGVMNVVGGWFATAIIASTVAALFAVIMYFGGIYGILALVALAGFFIYKTSAHHTSKLKKEAFSNSRISINYKDVDETLTHLTTSVGQSIAEIKRTLELTHIGVIKENKRALQEANYKLDNLNSEYAMIKEGLFKIIKKNTSNETTSAHLYVLTYDLMQDILQSLSLIVESTTIHVRNNHKPLSQEQCKHIFKVRDSMADFLLYLQNIIDTGDFTDSSIQELNVRKSLILAEIETATSEQISGIMNKSYGFKNTSLYLTTLMELKDIVAVATRFAKLYRRIYKDGKLM